MKKFTHPSYIWKKYKKSNKPNSKTYNIDSSSTKQWVVAVVVQTISCTFPGNRKQFLKITKHFGKIAYPSTKGGHICSQKFEKYFSEPNVCMT